MSSFSGVHQAICKRKNKINTFALFRFTGGWSITLLFQMVTASTIQSGLTGKRRKITHHKWTVLLLSHLIHILKFTQDQFSYSSYLYNGPLVRLPQTSSFGFSVMQQKQKRHDIRQISQQRSLSCSAY